jgi:hypothetical protein
VTSERCRPPVRRCAAVRLVFFGSASPSNRERREHNRVSCNALLCSEAGCIAPHLHVSVCAGVTVSPHIFLRRPHDAVGTRLAVCVRLCSCLRIRSAGICVGVPAEKSRLSAGLPRCHSSYRTDRKISCSLGTALSLSIRSCRQIPLRSFGCRSLIRPRFSSSRQQNPSLVHVPYAP